MGIDNKFIKYFFTSGWDNNLMIAFLSNLPFDSFEETNNGVYAYLPKDIIDKKLVEDLNEICGKYEIKYEKEEIKNKNWNEEWESNFEPVFVGSFCLIRADFHSNANDDNYKFVLEITPEMTFGTGHHETTYMMIELMSDLVMKNTEVFDFGAGTGVLSILAEKMGAKRILALDNDPIAVENISKNAKANLCLNISAILGDTADVEKFSFDVVLANINRNILDVEASNLSLSLRKGGFLLLSGILLQDKEYIVNLYENNSMKLMKWKEKGKWCALKFVAY